MNYALCRYLLAYCNTSLKKDTQYRILVNEKTETGHKLSSKSFLYLLTNKRYFSGLLCEQPE